MRFQSTFYSRKTIAFIGLFALLLLYYFPPTIQMPAPSRGLQDPKTALVEQRSHLASPGDFLFRKKEKTTVSGANMIGFMAPPPKNGLTKVPSTSHKSKKVQPEWIEKTHKAAEGDDWRAIEANSIRQLLEAKKSGIYSSLNGNWVERGPSNIPGRIVDLKIDYENQHLYAHSDHGIVFKSSNLAGENWVALNDQFPLGLDVASHLELFEDGKMVVCGWIKVDNFWGVYFTTDDGQTWQKATGFSNRYVTGIKRMASQSDTLYLFQQEYDPSVHSDYYVIYRSADQGASFSKLYESPIPVGDGGRHRKSDLWVSNDPLHATLYLNLEDSLFLVNKWTGERTFNSTISNLDFHNALLTGFTENGHTQLTAYEAVGDIGKFYSWNSTDQSWNFKGELTEWWLSMPFGGNSFSCSKKSGDVLYFGGILISKSTDGGATWETMDLDPTGSYALYHGDVPKVLTSIHPTTQEEEVFIGTDGGLYKMDDNEHFNSISIPSLNCTQLYKMVSRQSDPGQMFIGTQDNGYSHTQLGNIQQGPVDFTFQWGGDVSNVASGDGGNTFWLWWLGDGCNYMTGTDQALSTWSPYNYDGAIPYWEAPIWVPQQFPDRCYTAGFLHNSAGNYLIELKANPNNSAISTQFPTNFEALVGAKISAIAISPLNFNYFYVATENGYFLRSTDGGQTWNSTLLSNSMYPRVIHPSTTQLGEVWVGGSGYSNSPVYFSSNHGQTFQAMSTGMPACRVEAFAGNEEESLLFAATSIGPFVLDPSTGLWSDISGTDAPVLQYMDVEYIPSIQTARFATYARGIWDFQISEVSATTEKSERSDWRIYPTAARSFLQVEIDPSWSSQRFQIVDVTGKTVQHGQTDGPITRVDLQNLPAGNYWIFLEQNKAMGSLPFSKLP